MAEFLPGDPGDPGDPHGFGHDAETGGPVEQPAVDPGDFLSWETHGFSYHLGDPTGRCVFFYNVFEGSLKELIMVQISDFIAIPILRDISNL